MPVGEAIPPVAIEKEANRKVIGAEGATTNVHSQISQSHGKAGGHGVLSPTSTPVMARFDLEVSEA